MSAVSESAHKANLTLEDPALITAIQPDMLIFHCP
jgi:hypothetical protein